MLTYIDGILYDSLPYALLALGFVVTLRYLRLIDLTFAASFVLGPAVMAAYLRDGGNIWLGVLAGLALTCVLAMLTVTLIQRLSVEPLLAGVISSFAGYASALLFTQGTLSITGHWTPLLSAQRVDATIPGIVPIHPASILVFAGAAALAKVCVDTYLQSEHGLGFRAMEDGKSADRLLPAVGLSPRRLQAGGIVAGNVLAMASGTLVAWKQNQVTAQLGFDALITVITAYLLGTTLFEKRVSRREQRGFLGAFLRATRRLSATSAAIAGLLFFYAVITVVTIVPMPASAPKLAIAALLVISIALSQRLDSSQIRRHQRLNTVNTGSALVIQHAAVSYPGMDGPVTILQDTSLAVSPGEIVLLTAPNGKGKTTLLRFIAGEIDGAGNVLLPSTASRGDRRSAIGLVSQDATLSTCGTLTPAEHVTLFLGGSNPSPVRAWWHSRPSVEDPIISHLASITVKPVMALSGGQRQLLSIGAFVFRKEPPVAVLFDEPLSHLDEQNAAKCVALMRSLRDQGCRIVLVQHDLVPLGQGGPESSARAELLSMVTRVVSLDELEKRS